MSDSISKRLFFIRNKFGGEYAIKKADLLRQISCVSISGKKNIELLFDTLLFLLAYPDNFSIYSLAESALRTLEAKIITNVNLQYRLYNSGITGTSVCAPFSFEIVKWLREKYGRNVVIDSFDAPDSQILYILSTVMPQVESEILQDENSTWKLWLNKITPKGDDLLDTLILLFEQSPIVPEVKDELWNALDINIVVKSVIHTQLPVTAASIFYTHSLIKRTSLKEKRGGKPIKIEITNSLTEKIIESGRMVLVRYIREIDPISFSEPELITYYMLSRGLSIALFGMRSERRHPIDSYMGYVVFKNGLPVAYAGSWILFDSARIGLNIFPPYRGGESHYIFEQILKAHKQIFRLNRFSVDSYQIGKHNSDGIRSGAFWMYYKMGFRPVRKDLKQLAESEARKVKTMKGYRSSSSVLKKLAESRMELIVGKNSSVGFDATDLSKIYSQVVQNTYAGNRKIAQKFSMQELLKLLKWENPIDNENLRYVLNNWCVLLVACALLKVKDKMFIKNLKEIFLLKAVGNEEEYIRKVQKFDKLRKLLAKSFLHLTAK